MSFLGELEIQDEIILDMEIPDDFRMDGWIYVLANECMPGIYKIGMTTVSPEIRAKELSGSTGVPVPFTVVASYYSSDPRGDEQWIHELLNDFRFNKSREFFKCSLDEIIQTCNEICIARTNTKVQDLAMNYEIISFEKLKHLNINELLDENGLSYLGSEKAIAERLIRLGIEAVRMRVKGGYKAVVFKDSIMYTIKDVEGQYIDIHGDYWRQFDTEPSNETKGGF